MPTITIFLIAFFINARFVSAQTDPYIPNERQEVWAPVPRMVDTGTKIGTPPSDAIVLFNGSHLEHWVSNYREDGVISWGLEDGILTVNPGTGAIRTRESFGDCQLHVEWRTPSVVEGKGQKRGNSGIYLQKRYEVQILDSYQNRTYSNGQAASIYKQHIPLVNASKKPGEWQLYDIIFTAPRFNKDSLLIAPGKMTVLHNGVLVQHNAVLRPKAMHGKAPILLQDHSDRVSFRNIWVRRLD